MPAAHSIPRSPNPPQSFAAGAVGVSLKPQHFRDVLENPHAIEWFEVHPENYMGDGGPPHFFLERVRDRFPVSFHGVGLSLGTADGLDPIHLNRLKKLVGRYEPTLVSDHLSWSVFDGIYVNDLLPLPLTEESLELVANHVDCVQDALNRSILIENPSSYMVYRHSTMPEPVFLAALAERTGCGLLLDVNNIFVSACNNGWNPKAYVDAIPPDCVGEIHLAGHAVEETDSYTLRIDDHGSPVCAEVWSLYEYTLARLGPRPTLIEWDTNIPSFDVLAREAATTRSLIAAHQLGAAAL